MDQMDEDKLDGKIDAEFWTRKAKANDWGEQERNLEADLRVGADSGGKRVTVKRIFETHEQGAFSLSYEESDG